MGLTAAIALVGAGTAATVNQQRNAAKDQRRMQTEALAATEKQRAEDKAARESSRATAINAATRHRLRVVGGQGTAITKGPTLGATPTPAAPNTLIGQ